MRGYNSNVKVKSDAQSIRGHAHDTTYFVSQGPQKDITSSRYIWLKMMLHPRDIDALDVRVTDKWIFMPWKPWPGVSEEEKLAKEGTVALIRTDRGSRGDNIMRMRLNTGGTGRLEQRFEKLWFEQYLLGDKAEEFFDALAKYSQVHLLPSIRHEQEENEHALILGREVSIYVPSWVRENYECSLRRAKAAQANGTSGDSVNSQNSSITVTTEGSDGVCNVTETHNEDLIFIGHPPVESSAGVPSTEEGNSTSENACGDHEDHDCQQSMAADAMVFVEGASLSMERS